METITFLLGAFISCFVNTTILFLFMEEQYERNLKKKSIYWVIKLLSCLILVLVNFLQNPFLNIFSWCFIFAIIGTFFYYNNLKKMWVRILEIEVLILILTVFETTGIILLEFLLKSFNLYLAESLKDVLNMLFSKIIVLLCYYLIVTRINIKQDKKKIITKPQYYMNVVIIGYCLLNLFVILSVILNPKQEGNILLLINMGAIVFASMYLLYFAKFVDENHQLKVRLKLLEQQSEMQYNYYDSQRVEFQQARNILHDVEKHIGLIEKLYENNEKDKALEYTKEISELLEPLLPIQYSNDIILNTILHDKARVARKNDIQFMVQIKPIDLSFMESIDITTIFGNILDNAIEACASVDKIKMIKIQIVSYHKFVAIHLENSYSGKICWDNGRPCSQKGENHGIGLLNVEQVLKKYEGNIQFSEKDDIFQCDILLCN